MLSGVWLVLGEVALPGGKKEESDADDVETALREAKEEIGLDPSLVNVVTVLEPIFTKVKITLSFSILQSLVQKFSMATVTCRNLIC